MHIIALGPCFFSLASGYTVGYPQPICRPWTWAPPGGGHANASGLGVVGTWAGAVRGRFRPDILATCIYLFLRLTYAKSTLLHGLGMRES